MEDFGEIFTAVATLVVAVLGIVIKTQETKKKKALEHSRKKTVEALDVVAPAIPTAPRAARPVPESKFEEGQRMLDNPNHPADGREAPKKRKGLDIDKKKLILYSEILKPKFDE